MVSEGARPWGRGRSGDSEPLQSIAVKKKKKLLFCLGECSNEGVAAVLPESVLDQNGHLGHFVQNDLRQNWFLAFARPKWTKMVHFGLMRSILVHLGPPTVL